jgi:CheY-like chemotaxis protein
MADLEAYEDVLADIAHDLRSPLSAIIGFSALLQRDSGLSPSSLRFVQRIADASKLLSASAEDLVNIAALARGDFNPAAVETDPAALVREVLGVFELPANDKNLALTVEVDPKTPPLVRLDQVRLRQALANLVGNAVKYTDHGWVTVKVGAWEGGVRIEVADSGPGIPEEFQARLFQRFSRMSGAAEPNAKPGFGLGLSIVHRIITAMGGTIGVESKVGVGSTFWLTVPNSAAYPHPSPSSEPSDVAGMRVLLVEDDEASQDLATSLLEPLGADLTWVKAGEAAKAALSQGRYDVVLLDLRLPDIDGLTLVRQMRDEIGVSGETPIIAFSAEPKRFRINELIALGLDGFVSKPSAASELVAALTAVKAKADSEPDGTGLQGLGGGDAVG